jgi:hypothetical protein
MPKRSRSSPPISRPMSHDDWLYSGAGGPNDDEPIMDYDDSEPGCRELGEVQEAPEGTREMA